MSLQSNRLTSMEGMGACTALQELYLSHNGISSLQVRFSAASDKFLMHMRNLSIALAHTFKAFEPAVSSMLDIIPYCAPSRVLLPASEQASGA